MPICQERVALSYSILQKNVLQYACNIFMEVSVMAYKISDDCVACGACVESCPVEAIMEGDGKFEIDADKCISCGSCADACPVGAPQED